MKYKNELFTHNHHLDKLITKNGIKDIYDAVSKCTRCGYCLENCPSYVVFKLENYSPRGRNQIIRMLIEGKQKDVNTAIDIIDSCLLCGACSDVCYGSVKTPDIVLEARREEKNFGKSIFYRMIIYLRKKKDIFDFVIKLLYRIHKTGLAYVSNKLGLFKFLGYPSLGYATEKLIKIPDDFLHNEIKALIKDNPEFNWIYFLTCGTDYLFPEVGKSTIRVLKKLYSNGIYMENTCCGLVCYNYGLLEDARKYALKNIEIYEKIREKNPEAFIVADCSSCVAFMKSYPQLFIDDETNYKRALEFSSKVKDVIEVIVPEKITGINEDYIKDKKICIHHSCKAYNDQDLKNNQENVLKPILKEKLIELNESNMCCGGAGAYSFTKPEFSEKILKRKMENIAKTQASIVIVSSTSCLMQINSGAKKYYPITVMHYIEFIDKLLN